MHGTFSSCDAFHDLPQPVIARVNGAAPGSAHDHSDVRHGYVQQFLGEFAPDAAGDIAYLCGNPNMVDATFEVLKAAGLPVPHIRREKYVSSK